VADFVNIFKEFEDIFSWTYGDIKEYNRTIIHKTIKLKEEHLLDRN
jgi:hypothetical protein